MGITFSCKDENMDNDPRLCLRMRRETVSKFTSVFLTYQISPIVSRQELESFIYLACRHAIIDAIESAKISSSLCTIYNLNDRFH